MENLGEDILNDKHCSFCINYETSNGFMYCKFLKNRITARKRPCKEYYDTRLIQYSD